MTDDPREPTPRDRDRDRARGDSQGLAVFAEIAAALNASVDLDAALGVTLERVTEILGLETGWIWLLDGSGTEFYLAAARNLPPGLADDPTTLEGTCWCQQAFEHRKLETSNIGVMRCSRLAALERGTGGYGHHASVPLEAHGRMLGVFNVATRDWRALDSDELQILRTVSGLVSIAIERTRLHDETVRLAAAEERNRLAREVHDSIAQTFTALATRLELAQLALEGAEDAVAARESVARALALAREGLDDTRRTILDLRPRPLEGRSLAAALEERVAALGDEAGVRAELETISAAHPLPARVEAALYRIAQEALANASRHAGARRVHVALVVSGGRVRLTVRDDGRGMDPGRPPAGGLGITSMSERARAVGGTFSVASAPGEGTEIAVEVPLA